MNLKKAFFISAEILLLLGIIYFAIVVRIGSVPKLVADYDPWWYYRHSVEIMKSGLLNRPKWDILSFYPPGRPYVNFLGVEYILIITYYIFSYFIKNFTFMQFFIWSPAIISGLSAIPAYLTGKLISNKIGGIFTAIFAVLAPAFLAYSVAGYMDSKPLVVFFTFLSAYSIMLLFKKRKPIYYIFTILTNLLFIFTWGGGWFILIFTTALIPALFIFRIIENMIHQKKLSFNLSEIISEIKPLAIPLIIILIVLNVLTIALNLGNMVDSFLASLGFINPSQGLLVNISVAELQSINILTKDGFLAVASRVGFASTLLTLFGLPFLVLFKLWKRTKINFVEILMFLWAIATFYAILHGVRFALLFSSAAAVSAGYVIGNLYEYTKNQQIILRSTVFAVIIVSTLILVSDAQAFASSPTGFDIDQNWIDALNWLKEHGDSNTLVTTWWDPGHIITGYTGLKVHADGAHCAPGDCVPYDHNIRIQDMGRVFSTSNEDEAVSILSKYKGLTSQQCQDDKKLFGDAFPNEACQPVSTMYLIASSDLIGKYHWMSFFGLGTAKDYIQLPLKNYDPNQGILTYLNGEITLQRKGDQWVPVLNGKQVIKEIVYFENGEKHLNFTNVTGYFDGMVWVDPSFQTIIFMTPDIRSSLFTDMFFFNGEHLKHFQPVFSNSEIKIFKVVF